MKTATEILNAAGIEIPPNIETAQELFEFLSEQFKMATNGDMSIEPPEQKLCPLIYKSCECGYTGDFKCCDKTLTDCQNHGNESRFFGTPICD